MEKGKQTDFDAVAAEIVDDAAIGVNGDEIRLDGSACVDVQTVDYHLKRVKNPVNQRKRGGGHLCSEGKKWIRTLMGGGWRFRFCFSILRSRFCFSR